MSDQDKPEQEQGFLARWSQRKQEAKLPELEQEAPAVEAAGQAEPAELQSEPAEPVFDLSTLPKLEELTGSTDITAFLRKGVPEQIRNAALRKSWALDPAIRNYVNPALEYAYDWNAPGGVPGGGELGAGVDVARMVAQIMGDGPTTESRSPSAVAAQEPGDEAEILSEGELVPASPQSQPVRLAEQSESAAEAGSAGIPGTESAPETPAAPQQPVRRHGSAKPIV